MNLKSLKWGSGFTYILILDAHINFMSIEVLKKWERNQFLYRLEKTRQILYAFCMLKF